MLNSHSTMIKFKSNDQSVDLWPPDYPINRHSVVPYNLEPRNKSCGSMFMKRTLLCVTLFIGISSLAWSASFLTIRLDDPKAVYLILQEFGAHGDGQADDSAAIQAAIDKSETGTREGIVFTPSGRYRLTRTIYIWPGVRIFGYGAERPVFVLADNTPGFQQGIGNMVIFAGVRHTPYYEHVPDRWRQVVGAHRRGSTGGILRSCGS